MRIPNGTRVRLESPLGQVTLPGGRLGGDERIPNGSVGTVVQESDCGHGCIVWFPYRAQVNVPAHWVMPVEEVES